MTISNNATPKDVAAYLCTPQAIRERCGRVHELAKQGKLHYFDYHPEKEKNVVEFCIGIIKRDFGEDYASIPPHGRWRHLDAGRPRVSELFAKWDSASSSLVTQKERCKRMIDLLFISALLDAGAGSAWTYREAQSGMTFRRSEGLAVASVRMFEEGMFSGVPDQPYRVDAKGLGQLTLEQMAKGFQVTESNAMVGLEGRTNLMAAIGASMIGNKQWYGEEGRPGNIVDFLETLAPPTVDTVFHILMRTLTPIWPRTLSLDGEQLGDVWPCELLKEHPSSLLEGDDWIPFHKLTQWITYSLLEPLVNVMGWKVKGVEALTGLPEYRNGGLLIDLGVLRLRPNALSPDPKTGIPRVPASHAAIIEWRAMTIVELDRIAEGIRAGLNVNAEELTLAQILESATWKGGREIAKERRPHTCGPPIDIESDGTVM